MFKIGDLVVYGNTGVCRVTNIATHDINGVNKDQLYYFFKPLYQNCSIFTPIETNQVFMRPIISKEKANQLIDMIPEIKVKTYNNRVINELEEIYKNFIKSHSCVDLIKLIMSIYEKKQQLLLQKHKIGVVDERYLKWAEDLLFEELAAALEIPKESVPDYIGKRIGTERRKCDYECFE